jgi:MFS family permease
MFAGLGIALFILIHRQMMLELLGSRDEKAVTRWFAWFQAAFLFGAAAGGWLFGWLGDRIGRTRALGLSVLWCSLFTLAGYPVNSPELLMVLRFVACMGIGGVWPNAVALVAEAWPDASRPFLAGLLGAAANFGQVLMGVIGFYFEVTPTSWRWTLVVGALPAVFGIWILMFVPESVRWLAAKAKQPEAGRQSPIREVLRPPLLYRVMLGIGLGAIPVVGTAANGNWLVPWTDHVAEQQAKERDKVSPQSVSPQSVSPQRKQGSEVTPQRKQGTDPRSKARTQITRSTGGIFGSLLGGIIASLLGRRLSYFLISLSALVASTYIFTQLDPLHPQFQLFTFVLGFVGIIYFGWLPLFLPELFPTRVRSTGSGISFNTGRIVSGFVVLFAGFFLDLLGGDYARVGFWTGMIYAAGMIIIWFAPRRDNNRLED